MPLDANAEQVGSADGGSETPWEIFSRGTGEWEGEETMAPAPWAPDGMVAAARLSARTILRGKGLASEYVQTVEGQETMVAHTVFRWDQASGVFVMHFVTADGGEATVLEGRREGNRLIFEGTGAMGPMRQSFDYGDGGMGVIAEAPDPDTGEWSTLFEGRYTKKGAS